MDTVGALQPCFLVQHRVCAILSGLPTVALLQDLAISRVKLAPESGHARVVFSIGIAHKLSKLGQPTTDFVLFIATNLAMRHKGMDAAGSVFSAEQGIRSAFYTHSSGTKDRSF